MISDRKIFLSLFSFSVLIFLAHLVYTKTAVYGDGRSYYSYLPTFLLDHSLSFVKSFDHFQIGSFHNLKGPANVYPIGPAIIWAIPFTFANLFLIPFGKATGYGPVYDIFIGVWNIFLVTIGIYYLKKSLSNFFSERVSLLSSLAIFGATNLLFYGAVDVINSHSASFFFSSLFLYLFIKKRTLKNSFLLGLTIGALALIRSQDYLFFIFPLIDILRNPKYLAYSITTVLTGLILFIPQMLLWHIYYGTWFLNPYFRVQTFDFFHPHILGVFFNKGSGIIWTPSILISLYGLFKLLKKNFYIAICSLIIIFSEIYLIASWYYWWEGASYSARMLISSLPFFAFGIACFLDQKRIRRFDKWIVLGLFLLNNFLIVIFLLFAR